MNSAVQFSQDIIGWVLVVLNTFIALGSTYFFLGQLKAGLIGWLMMNSCAPSRACIHQLRGGDHV